ncbi:39S ribosomal protein L47, mitochondrial [Chamberlinius hualienensis]
MAAIRKFGYLFRTSSSLFRIKAICSSMTASPRLCSSQVNSQIQTLQPQTTDLEQQNEKSEKKYDLSGLMEFFDDPSHFGQTTVKAGRGWRIEELRIKSNSDLHKLWYVLLKERNMLLTMEYNCKDNCELFPNPERLDKVEESMENLESVVRERNKAYYELETKETGEAPSVDLQTPIGKLTNWEIKEYPIPKHQNKEWDLDKYVLTPKELSWFNRRWREQQLQIRKKIVKQNRRIVKHYLLRFPDVDEKYLQELYPDVNVERIKGIISRNK